MTLLTLAIISQCMSLIERPTTCWAPADLMSNEPSHPDMGQPHDHATHFSRLWRDTRSNHMTDSQLIWHSESTWDIPALISRCDKTHRMETKSILLPNAIQHCYLSGHLIGSAKKICGFLSWLAIGYCKYRSVNLSPIYCKGGIISGRNI